MRPWVQLKRTRLTKDGKNQIPDSTRSDDYILRTAAVSKQEMIWRCIEKATWDAFEILVNKGRDCISLDLGCIGVDLKTL